MDQYKNCIQFFWGGWRSLNSWKNHSYFKFFTVLTVRWYLWALLAGTKAPTSNLDKNKRGKYPGLFVGWFVYFPWISLLAGFFFTINYHIIKRICFVVSRTLSWEFMNIWGFPKKRGYPIAGWCISWNIRVKLDDDWGYPYDYDVENPSFIGQWTIINFVKKNKTKTNQQNQIKNKNKQSKNEKIQKRNKNKALWRNLIFLFFLNICWFPVKWPILCHHIPAT